MIFSISFSKLFSSKSFFFPKPGDYSIFSFYILEVTTFILCKIFEFNSGLSNIVFFSHLLVCRVQKLTNSDQHITGSLSLDLQLD